MKDDEHGDHQDRAANRGKQQCSSHGIARYLAHLFGGRLAIGREDRRGLADTLQLIGGLLHNGAQLAPSAEAVAARKAQQQTQIVDLQQIGQLRRIGARQQLLQVLKKDFAGHVMAVALLLQGLAGPVGKDRMPKVENRLVDKRDHRKNGELDVLLGIAAVAGLVARRLYSGPDLGAKGSGVRDRLAIAAQALADGN